MAYGTNEHVLFMKLKEHYEKGGNASFILIGELGKNVTMDILFNLEREGYLTFDRVQTVAGWRVELAVEKFK